MTGPSHIAPVRLRLSRANLVEIIARAICIDSGTDPDARIPNRPLTCRFWMTRTMGAKDVLAALADSGLAIVPREVTPDILAHGWAAINEGRVRPVDMAPGPALREAWPRMVAAADLTSSKEAADG